MDTRVVQGLELLRVAADDEMSLADAVGRIESVTSERAIIRKTIDRAELEGIIDREGKKIRTQNNLHFSFEEDVVEKEGDFTCRRCGSSLSTGHFVVSGTVDVGPFGPQCVLKVLGRA